MSTRRLQGLARELRRELSRELPQAVRLMAPALPRVFTVLAEFLEELQDLDDRLELVEAELRSRFPETTVTQRCLEASIDT